MPTIRIAAITAALGLAACFQGAPPAPPLSPPPSQEAAPTLPSPPLRIEWDDADSGRINGQRFRIANIDAPETGGVGAAIGAALCDTERERGLRAKAWAEGVTANATLAITDDHGFDRMREPRRLVDLTVDGRDYGAMGVAAGHLKPWPHEGAKRLAEKPDWCR